ncbi:MAG: peptidoglycan editing factor PgeF [Microcoleaceae cyanobacterium]
MHTWHWRTWNDLPYLTCSLLESWPHGFFTRHYSPRPPAALVDVLSGNSPAYRVRQVHGNRVLPTSAVQPQTLDTTVELAEADGLLTDQPQESVWSASADCVPVLIGDLKTGQVAAVHAGWRGTAAKIVPAAIARFQAQGSQLGNLRIALGPAISGAVYQVDQTVARTLGETVLPDIQRYDLPAAMIALSQLDERLVTEDAAPHKIRVDVRQFNQLQLEQLGLEAEQVASAPHCTYQEPENFFSYRRDGSKAVQWSGIISTTGLHDVE